MKEPDINLNTFLLKFTLFFVCSKFTKVCYYTSLLGTTIVRTYRQIKKKNQPTNQSTNQPINEQVRALKERAANEEMDLEENAASVKTLARRLQSHAEEVEVKLAMSDSQCLY